MYYLSMVALQHRFLLPPGAISDLPVTPVQLSVHTENVQEGRREGWQEGKVRRSVIDFRRFVLDRGRFDD